MPVQPPSFQRRPESGGRYIHPERSRRACPRRFSTPSFKRGRGRGPPQSGKAEQTTSVIPAYWESQKGTYAARAQLPLQEHPRYRINNTQFGAVAQLGERIVRNDEVGGSNPPKLHHLPFPRETNAKPSPLMTKGELKGV